LATQYTDYKDVNQELLQKDIDAIKETIGDPTQEDFEHLYLHANTIYFHHPRTNLPMRFDAEINKNMQDFIIQKFNKGLITNEKFTNFFNIFDDFSF